MPTCVSCANFVAIDAAACPQCGGKQKADLDDSIRTQQAKTGVMLLEVSACICGGLGVGLYVYFSELGAFGGAVVGGFLFLFGLVLGGIAGAEKAKHKNAARFALDEQKDQSK